MRHNGADSTALGGADPHDVLGVRRGASPQQVNRAFHREALRGGHPDTGGDARAFRRLVLARDTLLANPVTSPPRPHPTPAAAPRPAAPRPAQPRPGQPRPAPSRSDGSALPLIVLFFLFLVIVPHVLLALVLILVP
ncbi:hypothetical protein C1I92_29615 [Jiangella anatolica]|uniref:J domain-containing protein n=1 Tax=Jiangella anatolica TaxID=2670374 RepID=A0A2W2AX73_9ACTN|nr:hypothetical protein C1I92_29615 [Jiangella anatolica]